VGPLAENCSLAVHVPVLITVIVKISDDAIQAYDNKK